jgi:hypothetical protein
MLVKAPRAKAMLYLQLLSIIGFGCLTPGLATADVFKCKRGGVVSYQDRPCPKGTAIGKVVMDPPPVAGQTPNSSLRPPTPVPTTPPAPPAPAALPIADNYKCVRHDGTSYYSASLMPKRYYVPISALNPPRRELPPNGHIWVTDQCSKAPLKDACDQYNLQMDQVAKQVRSAKGVEKSRLEREARRLRTVSNSRCRGLSR